jgi:hypothetical protein
MADGNMERTREKETAFELKLAAGGTFFLPFFN